MKDFFLNQINTTINHYLQLDPELQHRLSQLNNKIIAIELKPFHFMFQCEFTDTRINVLFDEQKSAETIIRGTPLQLLNVMLDKKNRHQSNAQDIHIEGNAELAQQVIDLFDAMHIDWEEQLSKWTGDIPAYQIFKMKHRFTDWLSQANHTITNNISDYLHEEIRMYPAREALQDFFAEVDELRNDVDRADAHLQLLRNKILNEKDVM